jgi:hypothetical protein
MEGTEQHHRSGIGTSHFDHIYRSNVLKKAAPRALLQLHPTIPQPHSSTDRKYGEKSPYYQVLPSKVTTSQSIRQTHEEISIDSVGFITAPSKFASIGVQVTPNDVLNHFQGEMTSPTLIIGGAMYKAKMPTFLSSVECRLFDHYNQRRLRDMSQMRNWRPFESTRFPPSVFLSSETVEYPL